MLWICLTAHNAVAMPASLMPDSTFYRNYSYVRFVEDSLGTAPMTDEEFLDVAAKVIFPVDKYDLPEQDSVIAELREKVLPQLNRDNVQLLRILFRGAASPDGPYERNKFLGLEWNIFRNGVKDDTDVKNLALGTSSANDLSRRFEGANVYGGCYMSGHVEGNVVINLNGTLVDVDGTYGVFDSVEEDANGEPIVTNGKYNITERRSGVINHEQGWDERGVACNVFGGGYGENSEIWGSTTINLNEGYAFQLYGGGEKGIVGKKNSGGNYVYNSDYSTTVNLHGDRPGQIGHFDDLVECEYVYGGGLEGIVCGNTQVNLGNCRVFQSFGGACNADILGHTETPYRTWWFGC